MRRPISPESSGRVSRTACNASVTFGSTAFGSIASARTTFPANSASRQQILSDMDFMAEYPRFPLVIGGGHGYEWRCMVRDRKFDCPQCKCEELASPVFAAE